MTLGIGVLNALLLSAIARAAVPEPVQRLEFGTEGDPAVVVHGAESVPGFVGPGLQATGGGDATVKLSRALHADGGAIGLWVKPLWRDGDTRSHALLSLRWKPGGPDFMVLSQGFYEKTSGRALHFVLNQRHLGCRSEEQLEPARWNHVLVSWGQGRTANCKIYLDGRKVGMTAKRSRQDYASNGPLYIGSDAAVAHPRRRAADAIVDSVEVYDQEVGEDDAWALYKAQVAAAAPGSTASADERYPWVREVLGSYPERPLAKGKGDVPLEMRAVFDPDILWASSREKTDAVVRWTKEAGFNVLVAPAWQGRGARYRTDEAPVEDRVRGRLAAGDDPLSYLLSRAHESGIQVHAWFNVVQRRADFLPQFHGDGTPKDAFDVHDPEFRRFIVDLILDVVRRYPVDGVNLDHIRSMGFCTSGRCIEDYRRATGGSLRIDLVARRVSDEATKRLTDWNAAAVRDIVERVSVGIRAINPKVSISVDAHPLHPGLMLQGQDSVQWANDGLIDRIFNMDYGTKPDLDLVRRLNEVLHRPGAVTILFATYEVNAQGTVPRSPALLADYVRISRRLLPGSGVAFYHRKQMTDAQVEALRATVFSEPALAE